MPNAPSTTMRVLKIGSDPEALFYSRSTGRLIPANTLCGQRSMHAWIGTDGCASTAELRPRPARDVRLHVRDIAEAMTVIDRIVCQKKPDIVLVAQPCTDTGRSPCGGHIHTSFVLNDPIASPFILRGMVGGPEGDMWVIPRAENRSDPPSYRSPSSDPSVMYRNALAADCAFGLHNLVCRLNAVFLPLEFSLHPKERRVQRGYGSGRDAVRAEHIPVALGPHTIRWRLEYRYPSTWLSHPAHALLYLSLAKLLMNNYHHLSPLMPSSPRLASSLDHIQQWLDEFVQRSDVVLTEDTKPLPKILRFVTSEVAPMLQQPLVQVDLAAWTKFFNEGRFK